MKRKFGDDQQNEQPTSHLNSLNAKRTTHLSPQTHWMKKKDHNMSVGNPGSDLGQAQSVAGLYLLMGSYSLFCFNFFISYDINRVWQYLSFCLFLTEAKMSFWYLCVGVPIHLKSNEWTNCEHFKQSFKLSSCEFKPCSWWGVLDTTLCDKVCQRLTTGRWYSPGSPVSFTNKTDHYDITEILLKVVLSTINQPKPSFWFLCVGSSYTFEDTNFGHFLMAFLIFTILTSFKTFNLQDVYILVHWHCHLRFWSINSPCRYLCVDDWRTQEDIL